MVDECENYLKKRRLEKKLKEQEEQDRARKDKQRGRAGKRSFYEDELKKDKRVTLEDLR
jgi:hypothetical protein